ncbi:MULTISPECIES: ExbD/TolR family protein [Flagellimonas]|uniref:Biopolymer transporter ExbD n=2 Tax=Flagellimonas TaxID=444459 RepID=A0A3A1NC25_9FLAO|nr:MULTISPECIES: biopolymer transporter ExbD [Allomuricauda]RIV35699.1 biopolymer transporter ExbD [Allomuricauda lutimaris]SDQ46766.1 outer membrane transport energization protein ExbD [Allomuricauda zhangzhouensis]SDW01070.1 biopolymer transport protein ExbD [Allomuricauda zhangzhouensis]|tara:strand:- start:1790 stop:2176 length:387 start_codon:yes stop_codon:yes gene_type:complete
MKLKGRNKVSPEFSMSSMTDIVFLLLVFFMLTSNAPNALDLLLPKAKGKSTNTQNVSVTIDKNLKYYVNNEQINKEYIEIELKKALEGQDKPTIILRAEENVAIKEAVNVMDIANRNKYKVILAVRPN